MVKIWNLFYCFFKNQSDPSLDWCWKTLEQDLEETKIRTENCVFLLLITFCNNSVTMFIFRTRPPPISQLTSTISLLSPPHLTLVSTRVPAPGHLLLLHTSSSSHRRFCVEIKYCLALNKVGTAFHRVSPPITKLKSKCVPPIEWKNGKFPPKCPKFKIGCRREKWKLVLRLLLVSPITELPSQSCYADVSTLPVQLELFYFHKLFIADILWDKSPIFIFLQGSKSRTLALYNQMQNAKCGPTNIF